MVVATYELSAPNIPSGDSFASLLMHMDNTAGLTTFIDNGTEATAWSATAGATLSATQSMFGGYSLALDGTGDYISTTTGLESGALGSGDFTVECWVYCTSAASDNMVYDFGYLTSGGGGWQLYVDSGRHIVFYKSGIGTLVLTSSNTLTLNEWTHICAERVSGVLYLYINGVSGGSTAHTTNHDTTSVTTFAIGAQVQTRNLTYDWPGYIDECRITIGTAVYGGAFTPAGPFDAYLIMTPDTVTNPLGRNGGALVTTDRGVDPKRVLTPPKAGGASFTLDNMSGDYGPTSDFQAGIDIRLTAAYSGTTYNLHQSILDRPEQVPNTQFDKLVAAKTLGTLSRLSGKKISTALYSNITTDVALGYLLDAAGWPSGAARSLDVGLTTLEWWWLDNQDALASLNDLLNTEGPGAMCYESGTGALVFKSRQARFLEARSTVAQTVFRNAGAEPLLDQPFVYDLGLRDVINVCSLTVKTRAAQTLGTVWSLGSTVTLAAGETRQYTARQSGGDPFTAAVAPTTGGGDYTVDSGALASTPTLDRTSGASCTITLVAGAGGAVISGLRLRAQSVTVTNTTTVSNTISTATSQAQYGARTYGLRVLAEIPVNTAQDYANTVVSYYQYGRPLATIGVFANGSTERMVAALAREVGDRVQVIESNVPLNADFYVTSIRHSITAPATHRTTITLEQASGNVGGYFILDTSELDGIDVLGF